MRKWLACMVTAILVLGISGGAWASPETGRGGEHRIILSQGAAASTGISIRHVFGRDRVSAQVTDAQLAKLNRQGIAFELVPVRTVNAGPGGAKGKPGSGARVLPSTQVPYGVKMVYGNPTLAANQIAGGAGVIVAVLDTGSVDHPDFTRADGSKVITDCANFANRKSDLVQGDCRDGHGHGTHVTGTVAAAGGLDGKGIFGVAPEASILSYKVLTDNGRGYADDVARAIRHAADQGAHIISMSLGASAPSPDEQDAIRYANSKGVLVVASAGNNGPEADTIGYPGGMAEVVGVAALNPDEVVAYFSSRGITDGNDSSITDREVEVAAPGRATISTYKDGGYYTMSGTSMAAPHIAGLAAKRWQGSPGATRQWLVTAAKAHDITEAEQVANAGPGYDIAAGYGLPQVSPLRQSKWNN